MLIISDGHIVVDKKVYTRPEYYIGYLILPGDGMFRAFMRGGLP